MEKRLALAMAASLVICAGLPALGQEPSELPEAPDPSIVTTTSPAATHPLHGTWDYQLTDAEVEYLAELFGHEEASAAGIPGRATNIRLGLDEDTWWQGFVFDGVLYLLDGVPEGDGGRVTYEGDELTLTGPVDLGTGAGYARYAWSLGGDELDLTLIECAQPFGVGACPDTDVVRFVMEHTYTSTGSDPSYTGARDDVDMGAGTETQAVKPHADVVRGSVGPYQVFDSPSDPSALCAYPVGGTELAQVMVRGPRVDFPSAAGEVGWVTWQLLVQRKTAAGDWETIDRTDKLKRTVTVGFSMPFPTQLVPISAPVSSGRIRLSGVLDWFDQGDHHVGKARHVVQHYGWDHYRWDPVSGTDPISFDQIERDSVGSCPSHWSP